jgi:enterochelin esterase-like enzyme
MVLASLSWPRAYRARSPRCFGSAVLTWIGSSSTAPETPAGVVAAATPAALMVFQDGSLYLDPNGEVRAGVVFDNLMNRGEMPVTIGVFVDPGEPVNRNLEYDSFSNAYVDFLLTEILPVVQQRYRITDDPDRWAICGGSSGGSCAFTAAWLRPDRFRRVLSFLGSFAQSKAETATLNSSRPHPRNH